MARMFCAMTNLEDWERFVMDVMQVKNLFVLPALTTQNIRSIQESVLVNVRMIVQVATLLIFSRLR